MDKRARLQAHPSRLPTRAAHGVIVAIIILDSAQAIPHHAREKDVAVEVLSLCSQAQAHIYTASKTLAVLLDKNWSNFQIATSASHR